jgi:DNA-binding IclR family transcriptional regulator
MASKTASPRRRRGTASTGIKSIENGLPLLMALAEAGEPQPLTALAAATDMVPAKAHKYLTSFVRAGLARQHAVGGRYDLGPAAITLGTSALRRLDVFKLAEESLDNLRDQLSTTVSLAVWANYGPTLVRWAETPQLVSVSFRLGTVLPVLTSVHGRIFAAFLDRRLTQDLMRRELAPPEGAAARAGLRTMRDVEATIAAIRTRHFASAEGLFNPNRATIAAPVFDYTDSIVGSISVVGLPGALDISPEGEPVRALLDTVKDVSRQLGATSTRHW